MWIVMTDLCCLVTFEILSLVLEVSKFVTLITFRHKAKLCHSFM